MKALVCVASLSMILVAARPAQAAPVEVNRVATMECASHDGAAVAVLYDVTYRARVSQFVWSQLVVETKDQDTLESRRSEWHAFDYKTNTGFGFTSVGSKGNLTLFVESGATAPARGQSYSADLVGLEHLPDVDSRFNFSLQCKLL